tara:strand:+ start:357 stop:623 length:267 start_codon:yes stop_codon:yes gene_type:complete
MAQTQKDGDMEQDDRAKTTQVRLVEDKMAGKEEMGDQSRIICRKTQDTGSRLRSRRVCATAGEWAEQRRQNRESIEKTQAQGFGRSGN